MASSKPKHPGILLRDDYMKPLRLSVTKLASHLGVSRKHLSQILHGKSKISPSMALRFSRAFSTTPELWLDLQRKCDLWEAERDLDEISPLPESAIRAVELVQEDIPEGMHWSVPRPDALPEIDFDLIAEKANLSFTLNARNRIKEVLAMYIAQVRAFEKVPLLEQRQEMRLKTWKACKLLESFLKLDRRRVPSENEFDAEKLFMWNAFARQLYLKRTEERSSRLELVSNKDVNAEYSEGEFFHCNGDIVAEYLAFCRDRVKTSIRMEYSVPKEERGGRKRNGMIERCLRGLHQSYISAGGAGRGARRNEGAGGFSGRFLTFASMLLEYTKGPLGIDKKSGVFAESTLGAMVVNKYKIS